MFTVAHETHVKSANVTTYWTNALDCSLEQIKKGSLKSMKKYLLRWAKIIARFRNNFQLSNNMSFQLAQNYVMATVTLQIESNVASEKVFSISIWIFLLFDGL